MKKRILLLVFAFCLCFCGCGKSESQPEDFSAVGGEAVDKLDENMLTLSMRIPETLNPLLNREETVDRILKLIYLPLLTFDDMAKWW